MLETVLELKLAPRGAKTGFRGGWGARKFPQEGETDRQDGAKMAQEGPEEAHPEALGALEFKKSADLVVRARPAAWGRFTSPHPLQ